MIAQDHVPALANERGFECFWRIDTRGRRLVSGMPKRANDQLGIVLGILDEEHAKDGWHMKWMFVVL